MSNYAVIAQNDESPLNDVRGNLYHYPTSLIGDVIPDPESSEKKLQLIRPNILYDNQS